jgi:membrane associated rhomboid family serine protease
MFFPYSDDNPTERFPFVNLALIGINVVAFVAAYASKDFEGFLHTYGYYTGAPRFAALFTSAFLHAGVEHLVGNMWFLWWYGDNVEDRLGHFFYLLFYLASAVAAAILQTLLSAGAGDSVPMVGASGAVAGVLAAYLIFHPWAKINFFYWIFFFYAGVVQIPACLVIGFWMVGQFTLAFLTHGQEAGIAYWAHLGGFGLGLAAAGSIRAAGWVGRPRDVRLQGTPEFRRALANEPWLGSIPDRPAPLKDRMREGLTVRKTTVEEDRLQKAKQLLIRLIDARDLKQLPRYYSLFERRWPTQSLPERQQWQAAELLREAGRDALALEAYRKVADQFPEGSCWASACLHVGQLYDHHRNYVRARQYWELLLRQRPAAREAEEARAELQRIEKALASTAVETGGLPDSGSGRYWVLRQTFDRIDSSREIGRAHV